MYCVFAVHKKTQLAIYVYILIIALFFSLSMEQLNRALPPPLPVPPPVPPPPVPPPPVLPPGPLPPPPQRWMTDRPAQLRTYLNANSGPPSTVIKMDDSQVNASVSTQNRQHPCENGKYF